MLLLIKLGDMASNPTTIPNANVTNCTKASELLTSQNKRLTGITTAFCRAKTTDKTAITKAKINSYCIKIKSYGFYH